MSHNLVDNHLAAGHTVHTDSASDRCFDLVATEEAAWNFTADIDIVGCCNSVGSLAVHRIDLGCKRLLNQADSIVHHWPYKSTGSTSVIVTDWKHSEKDEGEEGYTATGYPLSCHPRHRILHTLHDLCPYMTFPYR